MPDKVTEREMLEHFDCAWSGNDYHPPCDIKECSEYRNGKCLKSRKAIRALIIAVGEWQRKAKKHLEILDDEPLPLDVLDALDTLEDIRDFGKEGK